MDQNTISNGIQKMIENKKIFLVVVVFLVFIVGAVMLFGDYSSKLMKYKTLNETKLAKIALVGDFNKSNEGIASFLKSLPDPLGADELAARVQEYAVQHKIDIIDMSAKDPQNFATHRSIAIRMSLKVTSFKGVVAFLDTIEKSPYALRVESFLVKTKNSADGSFGCEINIIAIQIKK